MKAVINIKLKDGILDPAGKAVLQALKSKGNKDIKDVRIGKQIVIELNPATDKESAKAALKKACEEFLANTVVEEYEIVL
ncbi:phosphoribosylformylglycinamidine synthase subunit PurS [uncultured Campylobacter sp.]|uniref:phosphoribosylformylglycinamidine synthase subunit PurS n=1 Tax=uncultured Campylobacter sp. TaxID=218934 RepID=UPI002606C721|nr:phosphoribosylformylglycinamidine synthase subunit PurS [uncultured Campylobacter sp.]